MCGIVAYLGEQQAYPVILKGLKRLEYRGYDSAGIALIENKTIQTVKKKGKVAKLEEAFSNYSTKGSVGIGHTRWATHGPPSDENAHPHVVNSGRIAIVHNGIIENYASIKAELITRGYTFSSETDTEVLVALIDDIETKENVSLDEAVRIALTQVVGAYAIVILSEDNPNKLIAAKKGSPLVIGVGEKGEFYLASDATPIVEYTKNVVYLEDEEIAVMELGSKLRLTNIKNQEKTPYVQTLELNLEAIEKGGYDHFMLKEIFEQSRSIRDCIRGRMLPQKGMINMGGIHEYEQKFKNARRLIIVGCGTSWHAGLVAEYIFEEIARIPVEVEYASEFRYRNPIIFEDDIVIAISQSGETADTIAAIEMAKQKGALIFGVCNVVGSTISRLTDAGAYTHAGPEIGVASTKAFTAQVTVLTMMALHMANSRGAVSSSQFNRLLFALDEIPNQVAKLLESADNIKQIASLYDDVNNALFLGRGINFPVALEGALKLKEISYIHAEGYPAAEMKHGPIALIDEEMPVFVIANNGENYHKVVSNIQEVKARKGKVIAVVTEGDTEVKAIADNVLEIPETEELLTPLLAAIPLQLISYYVAVNRECNVDQPRNLAKSVTVE